MRLGTRLANMLRADAAIASLVGAKIHPMRIPEGEQPPAIIYTEIFNGSLSTLTEQSATRTARVQFMCVSQHYDGAHAIADAIEAVIDARAGNTPVSLNDGPIFSTARRLDLRFDDSPQWYSVVVDASMLTIDT